MTVPSPATFETPANIHNSQHLQSSLLASQSVPSDNKEPKIELKLDQFFASHTSQDNESFTEILIESQKKHREKYSYLYNGENESEKDKIDQLALPSIEKQAALPEKQLNVDTWTYKNQNHIMFTPNGVPLTDEEIMEINKNKQEVVHYNTRLNSNPFNDIQSKDAITSLAKSQSKILDGKIGVDGKELIPGESPKIRGFSFVQPPSPSPGALSTPLMTWGEIEGTPFRLDGGTPRTPSFKMSEPPRREQIALALAEKVAVKNKIEKQKAIDVARRQFASPRVGVDRLGTMSPAARRFATGTLRLGSGVIGGSNYSPSPLRRTPKSTPKRLTMTPKLNLGIKRVGGDGDHLTDDLLKIDLPKRQKAADFF